jgi:hypothetical protein
MRKVFLGIIAVLSLGSFWVAPTALAIDCNGIGIYDCDNASTLIECAVTCVERCSQLLAEPDQIIDHPDYCGICQKVSMIPLGGPIAGIMSQTACVIAGASAIKHALCEQGPSGKANCCMETVEENTLPKHGKCLDEKEKCKDGTVINYSCCVCAQVADGKKVETKISESRDTYTSCQQKCQALKPSGTMVETFGAGVFGAPKTSNEPGAAELQQKSALCFTSEECAKPEYGKSTEAFRAGQGCPSGQGRCVAPEPELTLSFPIGGVKTVQGLRNFIALIFNYLMTIAATAAAVMFVYGGFRYIVGSAAENVSRAKEIMVDAAIGLLLTLGAFTILQTVNPATLSLNRLDVFMINRQRLLSSDMRDMCGDIKPMGSDKLSFAAAGQAPNYTDINQAKFEIEQSETECGVEYYVQGFDAKRCFGVKCKNGGGCVQCKGGGCKAGAAATSFECKDVAFAGAIKHIDSRYADKVTLFVVCGDALKTTIDKQNGFANNNIHTVADAELTGPDSESGTRNYSFAISEGSLKNKALEECENEGGVVGFLLGVEYNDPGLLGMAPSIDEVAIVGKNNCGAGLFVGYMDGNSAPSTEWDMEAAIACAINTGSKKLSNPSAYWSSADLKAAVGMGTDKKPLYCNFGLSSSNAPSEPATEPEDHKLWSGKVQADGVEFTCPGI